MVHVQQFQKLKNLLILLLPQNIKIIFPNQGTEVSNMAIVGILAAWNGSAKQMAKQ